MAFTWTESIVNQVTTESVNELRANINTIAPYLNLGTLGVDQGDERIMIGDWNDVTGYRSFIDDLLDNNEISYI